MPSSADLVIRVLADTSGATGEISKLQGALGKALGLGAVGGLVAVTTQAATDLQAAMARVQAAYNNVDFAPGTSKYVDAQNTILQKSTELATNFNDLADVYAQAARFTDEYGNKLPTDKVNEYADAVTRLSKVSSDGLSAQDVGQQESMFERLFNADNFSGVSSAISALSGMHTQGEGPVFGAATAIAQVGAEMGVSQAQSLGLANYLVDRGVGGQMGGSSIGRLLLNMTKAADSELDPESKHSDTVKSRNATERLDDLQTQLKEAEASHAEMFGQNGLKRQFRHHPSEVMAADDHIARLQREIADQKDDIAHLGDAKTAGGVNIAAMAGVAGADPTAFAQSFKNDPISAILSFAGGLHNLPPDQVDSALAKAGIKNVRDIKTLSTLAVNPDLASSMIDIAGGQLANPTDLTSRSDIALGTTAAKVTDVLNAGKDAAAVAGEPERKGLDAAVTSMLNDVRDNGFQPLEDKATQVTSAFDGLGTAIKPVADLFSAIPAPALLAGGAAAAKTIGPLLGAGAGSAGITAAVESLTVATGTLLGVKAANDLGAFLGKWFADSIRGPEASERGFQRAKQFDEEQGATHIAVNVTHAAEQTAEQVWDSIKGKFVAAWNAAMSGHPVTGEQGGSYTTGLGPA